LRLFFNIYQYIAPLVVFPGAYYLWWQRYEGDHQLVVLIMSIPILFSYIVPGVGTNILKLWEFDTRLKLGRFRFYHGFVFGSATSLITLITLPFMPEHIGLGAILQAGFILGSVLAFWNWLYDLFAIKAGFITIYNRAWFEDRKPEVISLHYAPAIFGFFGFFYGISVKLIESMWLSGPQPDFWVILLTSSILNILVTVGSSALLSQLTLGETGFKSYEKESQE